jgi:hypothetical protein
MGIGLPGPVSGPDDDHRARRVGDAMDTHRANQHSGERPMIMASHDEQDSFLRLIDQYLGRVPVAAA